MESLEVGNEIVFAYRKDNSGSEEIRVGRIEKILDFVITIWDYDRNAFRSFTKSKMTLV